MERSKRSNTIGRFFYVFSDIRLVHLEATVPLYLAVDIVSLMISISISFISVVLEMLKVYLSQ